MPRESGCLCQAVSLFLIHPSRLCAAPPPFVRTACSAVECSGCAGGGQRLREERAEEDREESTHRSDDRTLLHPAQRTARRPYQCRTKDGKRLSCHGHG
eukprot:1281219-Rhodomonas_salina.2